jgi:serine/threonine protein kinase
MADWAGKTLGKVHIEKLVARGGMAEVYKGDHEAFGQVAIKVMRGLLDTDSEHLSRFQREAEVIADLKHPYIVLRNMWSQTRPCLIMEYAPVLRLPHTRNIFMSRNSACRSIVANLLRSIASAPITHTAGLFRDIKPANVLSFTLSKHRDREPLPMDVDRFSLTLVCPTST